MNGYKSKAFSQVDLEMLKACYAHYAHLENSRYKYIVWLYSVTLAIIAFLGLLYRVEPTVDAPLVLVGLFSFTVLFIFASVVYAQVIATQAAITGYDALLESIWKRLYNDEIKEVIGSTFGDNRIKYLGSSIATKHLPSVVDVTPILGKMLVAYLLVFAAFSISFAAIALTQVSSDYRIVLFGWVSALLSLVTWYVGLRACKDAKYGPESISAARTYMDDGQEKPRQTFEQEANDINLRG